MAKKGGFDSQKMKEFLLKKGERVGLAAAAGIAVLVLLMGFMGPSTKPPAAAGGSWSDALKKAAGTIRDQIRTSKPDESVLTYVPKQPDASKEIEPVLFPLAPWFNPALLDDDKRRNPNILAVEPENMQIDYLPGEAPAQMLVYQIDFSSKTYWALQSDTGKEPVTMMDPKRMVVVTGTFPLQKQLEEYQKALRYESLDELKTSNDLPRFLGLNVYRTQVRNGQEDKQAEALYVFDKDKQKTVVDKKQPELDRFLRGMKIDEPSVTQVQSFLGPNMMTPLPQLASVSGDPGPYPKLKLDGIEMAEEPAEGTGKPLPKGPMGGAAVKVPGKTAMPMGEAGRPGGAAATEVSDSTVKHAWNKLPSKDLWDRLKGDYNPLDPLPGDSGQPGMQPGGTPGGRPASVEAGGMSRRERVKGSRPMMPMNPMDPMRLKQRSKGNEAVPNVPGQTQTDEDRNGAIADPEAAKLLVRFIDIDVEVGKTYKYYIQVVMANPNHKKEKQTSSKQLAGKKELLSAFTYTRPKTIPPEYYYYVIDMPPGDVKSRVSGNDWKATTRLTGEAAPVQIHLWRDTVNQGNESVLGEWVIVERLLTRRGEPIGRKDVICEIPEWDRVKGKLTLAISARKKRGAVGGIPVNLLVDDPPSLLVDFRGGKHDRYNTPTRPSVTDEAAIEALVLAPDGKLVLRNSRVDQDDAVRRRHYDRWLKQLSELHQSLREAASTATPNMPLRVPGRN